MKRVHFEYKAHVLLFSCKLVLCFAMFCSSIVSAQTADSEPPVVGLDSVSEAIRSDTQKFTISVRDNEQIDSVVFHYRLNSTSDDDASREYLSAAMAQVDQSDQYTFTIPASEISASVESVEYYIEAQDDSGNRTLQGFFFDPLERTLIDKPAVVAGTRQPASEDSTSLMGSLSTTQKVLYGVLGVVVVGALISSSGSSGGGETTRPLVPVTIISDPPIVSAR